jgi:hypothetical protein
MIAMNWVRSLQMNKTLGLILQSFLLVSAFSISACGTQKKAKYDPTKTLTEQQKTDLSEKTKENIQMRKALNTGVYLKYTSLRIIALTDSRVVVRMSVELNSKDRSFLLSTPIEKSDEQFEIQDKTNEILSLFPNQNFEISSYRFKSGTVDMMAYELRFLKTTSEGVVNSGSLYFNRIE